MADYAYANPPYACRVEQGVAPETIVATKFVADTPPTNGRMADYAYANPPYEFFCS